MLPYANWKDTDATNVLLLVRIRLGVPFQALHCEKMFFGEGLTLDSNTTT